MEMFFQHTKERQHNPSSDASFFFLKAILLYSSFKRNPSFLLLLRLLQSIMISFSFSIRAQGRYISFLSLHPLQLLHPWQALPVLLPASQQLQNPPLFSRQRHPLPFFSSLFFITIPPSTLF
uniref:Uncharacterized protein n=1 Tax=Cacopsylla melanoneura TaxID=428564 RepID=A0A8D8Z4T4_9HEMI